jgi:DNA replication ATP-dependent helicase Dna2
LVHDQSLAQKFTRSVRELYEHAFDRGEPFTQGSVGVITPFRAQIAAITHELAALFPRDRDVLKRVTVDTVERYQGSERDTIVMSFAVSHGTHVRSVQSLSPDEAVDRKLNVALTRARKRLIVLGCTAALESTDSKNTHIKAFIEYVRESGGFVGTEM